MNATLWRFSGLFFGGEKDQAGTPIGDRVSGEFVCETRDPEEAAKLLATRYENNAGYVRLSDLVVNDFNPKRAERIAKRGGTADVPFLR